MQNYPCENRFLLTIFDPEKPFYVQVIRAAFVFFPLPIVLAILAYHDNLLIIEGDSIGMLEDLFFFTGAFLLVPFSIFLLRFVERQLSVFIEEIPSFTKLLPADYLNRLVAVKYTSLWTNRILVVLKILFVALAIATNSWSIYHRSGGWNSMDHLPEFYLTSVFVMILALIFINVTFSYFFMIGRQIKLTRKLASDDLIELKPMAPDKSGGLKCLGDLSLSYVYFLVPIVLATFAHYITWGALTVGLLLDLLATTLFAIFLFFGPTWIIHKTMVQAKKRTLRAITRKYTQIDRRLMGCLESSSCDDSLAGFKNLVDLIDNMYRKAKAMPVWPFDLKILTRFLAISIGPIVYRVIEIAIRRLLDV